MQDGLKEHLQLVLHKTYIHSKASYEKLDIEKSMTEVKTEVISAMLAVLSKELEDIKK